VFVGSAVRLIRPQLAIHRVLGSVLAIVQTQYDPLIRPTPGLTDGGPWMRGHHLTDGPSTPGSVKF
jgi:hypothetical protein